ncbi:homoserine dehydrogenase [Chitinimonas sp. BJYL2]|uniref:homoserine dehydrogenase n=1 Tax=Chitinimonas sp. BJYL2 TaxID=2976696 RepID=UPI0022B37E3C|nr:homoserine dehydrogenase [Chitinimonas sp. BJYL2]
MNNQRIAIIGLGRIGSAFLDKMLPRHGQGIELVCVAEVHDTPGRQQAIKAGIGVRTLDDVVHLGQGVDVIFDLTGLPDIRRELREKLAISGNRHTTIASESVVRVIWSLISTDILPVIEGRQVGY